MGQISNRFYVTSIKDGTIVTAALYADATLEQRVTPGTNACVPDWTANAGDRPTVWCVVRTGSSVKQPTSFKWYLNGEEILFPANPSTGTPSTNKEGAFQWVADKTVSGVTCPAIKIAKNLVGIMNSDNDVLTCEGYVEYNGAQISYTVNTTIRLSTLSGSGYYGWVSGDSYVTAQTGEGSTAVMKARLRTADGTVNSFFTKWYREGIDTDPFISVSAGNQQETGVAQVSITGAQITDYVVVRVDFYENSSSNKVLYSAYWDVDDMEDEEEMYICSYENNVNNGLDVSLRTGQTAYFLAWMGKRGQQDKIDDRYQTNDTTYKCRILDVNGAVITNYSDSGVRAAGGDSDPTPDGNGYINIKCNIANDLPFTVYDSQGNPRTTIYGGKVNVPATFADSHGGKLTGIVVVTA